MSEYFIITSSGSRGPFSAAVIQKGVAEGKIPPNAQLKDAATDATVRAGDIRADALGVETPMAESGAQPVPATDWHPAPTANPQTPQATYPPPAPSPYPQAAYPQATPANYPQATRHQSNLGGNYPRGPYPGPQQPYPQYPYPAQQYPQPQAYQQPYGQPYGHGPQYQPGMYPMARPQSALAIASLVLSLSTLVVCLPLFIGGIICGAMALKECEPNGPKQGRGLALGGLWTGVGIAVLYVPVVILWMAAIAAGP